MSSSSSRCKHVFLMNRVAVWTSSRCKHVFLMNRVAVWMWPASSSFMGFTCVQGGGAVCWWFAIKASQSPFPADWPFSFVHSHRPHFMLLVSHYVFVNTFLFYLSRRAVEMPIVWARCPGVYTEAGVGNQCLAIHIGPRWTSCDGARFLTLLSVTLSA